MINNTTLVGRLTKTPELSYTNSGIAVTSFTLAVERNYTNANGDRETDFIMCQSWRGTAEIIAKLGVKGALVGVTGNIQTRNYENNQGQKVYVTEIVVDNFQMMEPKSVTDERRNQMGQPGNDTGQNNQYNNQNVGNSNQNWENKTNKGTNQSNMGQNNRNMGNNDDPFANSGTATDIDDDDLPF